MADPFILLDDARAQGASPARLYRAPRDIVVVPGWMAYTLHAADDLVLFSYSDRVAQEKLGFYREQRLAAWTATLATLATFSTTSALAA